MPSPSASSKFVLSVLKFLTTRNPASRGFKCALLVAMYIAVVLSLVAKYVDRVTSEVAVSFLPEVVAQI